jgi:transcription antitermination factor NusG
MLPGVVDLIGFGKLPAPIPDAEIDRVRKMVESGLPVASWPYLTAGDTVLIESGPLAGLEGILLRTKGKYRLVVSVNLLQRSVAAEIDRGWVRPLRQRQSGILV